MEKEHTQNVVERAYAFVEDMFGLPHGDKTPYGQASPMVQMIPAEAGLTCDDAMGLDPYTFKSVGGLHIESAANDAGTKEPLSPAELHADGPLT